MQLEVENSSTSARRPSLDSIQTIVTIVPLHFGITCHVYVRSPQNPVTIYAHWWQYFPFALRIIEHRASSMCRCNVALRVHRDTLLV